MSNNNPASARPDGMALPSPDVEFPHQPAGARLAVLMDPAPETTDKGIHVPDSARKVSNRGRIVAVGPGSRGSDGQLHPPDFSVGDRILIQAGRAEVLEWQGFTVAIVFDHQVVLRLGGPDEN